MNKVLQALFIISILSLVSCVRIPSKPSNTLDEKTKWVDSIYNKMSLQEKVGQLFMAASYSNRDKSHTDSIQNLIKNNKIGGLIFFQGGPVRQAKLTNTYQSISKVPLLIGIDGEWGLNMRLDSTSRYPFNMTLGAIEQNDIIRKIGKQIGRDFKRLGIHLNFAPVVDINTNPKNPIIGVRSFGEDKVNVTKKAMAFTEGLQSEGILACAKHFPGHGDTDVDSHNTLPTISFTQKRIDSVELYPYKELFKNGLAGVMVAHLNVPSFESTDGLPSSLSHTIVSNILKDQLEFKGLVYTDALNMKGAANYKEPGDIDLAAFKAGNDVLLLSENAPKAISKIIEAYNSDDITEERLSNSVKKILAAKFTVGLNNFRPIEINGLINDLNEKINAVLYKEAIGNAITVIKNDEGILPLQKSTNEKIAYLKLGDGNEVPFLNEIMSEGDIYNVSNFPKGDLMNKLKDYNKVIIGYHRKNSRATTVMTNEDKMLIERISKNNKTILDVFASQYSLQDVSLKYIEGVVVSYENSIEANKISAEIIFGVADAKGNLPASISETYVTHYGIHIKKHN